jgi:hypothetical protein
MENHVCCNIDCCVCWLLTSLYYISYTNCICQFCVYNNATQLDGVTPKGRNLPVRDRIAPYSYRPISLGPISLASNFEPIEQDKLPK